jgi:hypothetical protein
MLKSLAVAFVAVTMSVGLAQARISGMSSLTHAHFPTCAEGQVKATCVCRASGGPARQQLCTAGRFCHTFDGACRQ